MLIGDAYERVGLLRNSTREVMTLNEVKDHLNISRGFTADDGVLKVYRAAAKKRLEGLTGRTFLRTHRFVVYDDWSTSDSMLLPYPPIIAVTSSTAASSTANQSSGAAVAYRGSTKNWNSFSSTAWSVDTLSSPGRLVLDTNDSWPSSGLHNVNPIRIHYTAGYSTASSGIPEDLNLAMKMLLGHYYENRESITVGYGGIRAVKLPESVMALITDYRIY